MNKKYVVPVGMLDAAVKTWSPEMPQCLVRPCLEAALQWLADNPIVPTQDQVIAMYQDRPLDIGETGWASVEWQRRMFLAPEPEVPANISAAIRGITLTEEQGKRIIEMVRMCVHHKPRPVVQNLE